MNEPGGWRVSPATDWSCVRLTGRDVTKFLNNFCTADLKKIPAGQAGELMLLNAKGHVLAWGAGIGLADGLQLLLSGLSPDQVMQHLDAYLFAEDVRITVADTAVWLVEPRPWDSADPGLGTPPLLDRPLLERPLLADLPDGTTLAGSLWPTVGQAFFLWLPSGISAAAAVESAVAALSKADVEGRPENAGQVRSGSVADYQDWRIRHGIPRIGQETVPTTLPQELLRNPWAISFTKGCYLGQETVARLDAMGHVNWNLRSVRLEPSWPADQVNREMGALSSEVRIVQGQQAVGQLTSASGSRGLARIRASVAADWAAGRCTTLELRDGDDQPLPSRIVGLG